MTEEMRDEYDFSDGERGKYANRYVFSERVIREYLSHESCIRRRIIEIVDIFYGHEELTCTECSFYLEDDILNVEVEYYGTHSEDTYECSFPVEILWDKNYIERAKDIKAGRTI